MSGTLGHTMAALSSSPPPASDAEGAGVGGRGCVDGGGRGSKRVDGEEGDGEDVGQTTGALAEDMLSACEGDLLEGLNIQFGLSSLAYFLQRWMPQTSGDLGRS